MLVSKDQIKRAVTMYIDAELMPKATQTQKLLTVGVSYFLLKRLDDEWIRLGNNQYLNMIGIGMVDGKIESKDLIDAAKYAFDKCGAVNIGGVILAKTDIDTFERCLNEVVAMGV